MRTVFASRISPALVLAALVLLGPGGVALAQSAAQAREAREAFARAVGSGDATAVKGALGRLVGIGGEDAVELIVKALRRVPASNDSLYWLLIQGASSFVDPPALERLGGLIVKLGRAGISRDLLYGLSSNRSPNVLRALAPIVRDGEGDLRLLAVQKVSQIVSRESVDILIEALKKEEQYREQPHRARVLNEVLDALFQLTGQKFGPNSINWEGWWKKNRETAALGETARDEARKHTGTVVDSLDRDRLEEFFGLEKAPKKGVVVLSAEYEKPVPRDLNNDHIQHVLDQMGIPHVVVRRPDFMQYDMNEAGALIINCAQFHRFCICPTCKPGPAVKNRLYRCTGCERHQTVSMRLKPVEIEKITRFVEKGGYVFGEDWVIKELLEAAYPKLVRTGTTIRTQPGNDTVDVVPARGMVMHPYLRGVFRRDGPIEEDPLDIDLSKKGRGRTVVDEPEDPERENDAELVEVKHRWVIDDESWTFDIQNNKKVLVLLTSGELQQAQEGHGTVAFAFRPGSSPSTIGVPARRAPRAQAGVVMQVLSHFGKQESFVDEALLQNLLLNFLIDANVKRMQRAGERPVD